MPESFKEKCLVLFKAESSNENYWNHMLIDIQMHLWSNLPSAASKNISSDYNLKLRKIITEIYNE